ncbi:AMP-binding protein [Streptomyces sp. NPDC058405]|uniref:AMP-binding protein n=1 Tax=unclassified Streptomyces TaxID=2593676 RepID=UPI003648777E
MNVLILGGSYFLGPQIVAAFQLQGWNVSLLNRGSRPVDGTEQLVADRDFEDQFREALGQRTFDAVVDVSCYTKQQAAVASRVLAGRAKSLTLVSTAAVYAHDGPEPRQEDEPTGSPTLWGEYGIGKSEAEEEYLGRGPTPAVTVLRASYIYGPGALDSREMRLWQLVRADRDVVLPGDGSTQIQLLHVKDFAAAVLQSVELAQPESSRVYNVAGQSLLLRDLVALAHNLADGSATTTSEADSDQSATLALPYPAIHCNLDTTKIERELGWRGTIALEDGLAETFSADAANYPVRDQWTSAARMGARRCFRTLAGVPEVVDAEIVPVGDQGLDAYVATNASLDLKALAETLRSAAGCPVEVRRVPAIPLSPSGRVDLEELRALPQVEGQEDERVASESMPALVTGTRPALVEMPSREDLPSDPPNLRSALEQAANETPEHSVTSYRSDGRRVDFTYQQLAEAAHEVAGRLHAQGLQPGDLALLPVGEVDDFIRTFWGCVVAGVVPVPIAKAILVRDADRLAGILSLLDGCWTLAEDELHELARIALEDHPPALSRLRNPNADETASGWTPPTVRPDEQALMLLTSGSTGVPKGVPLTHRNVLSRTFAAAEEYELGSCDPLLNFLPMDHVTGLVMMHVAALCLGQPQVQVAPEIVLGDPLRWIDLLSEHKVVITFAPNFAFAEVNRALNTERGHGPWNLNDLRVIINAGEAVNTQTAGDFTSALEPHGLRLSAMVPTWGMSETTSGTTSTFEFERWLAEGRETCPVGRPLPGMALRVVDHADEILLEGQVGHLQVRGPMVIDRYAGSPQITKDSFTSDGWFRTGDMGTLIDGQLALTGRSKEVVVINGNNVSCQEIEALVQRVPGVRHGYAAACLHRPRGAQTDGFVVIFAVADETEAMLVIAEVRRKLASEGGLSPVEVLVTEPDAIPRTNIGKVRRTELAAEYQEGTLPVLASDRLAAIRPVSLGWHHRVDESGVPAGGLGTVLLTVGQAGLGEAVVASIRSTSADVLVVADSASPGTPGQTVIDTASEEAWTALLMSLHEDGRAPDVIALTGTYETAGAPARTGEWQAVRAATVAVAEALNESRIPTVAFFRSCDECSRRQVPYLPEGVSLTSGTPSSFVLLDGGDLQSDAADALAALRSSRLDPVVRYERGARSVPWSWSVAVPSEDAPLTNSGSYATIGGDESFWSEVQGSAGVKTQPYSVNSSAPEQHAGVLALLPEVGSGFPFNGLVSHQDLHLAVGMTGDAETPLHVVVEAAGGVRRAQEQSLLAGAFASGRNAAAVPASEQEMQACVIRGGDRGGTAHDTSSAATDVMLRIWSDLLRQPVRASDNVFNCGADSMRVLRFTRVCEEAGWHVDALDVFAGQTVEEMAAMARAVGPGVPGSSIDDLPDVEIGGDEEERRLIEARLNRGV